MEEIRNIIEINDNNYLDYLDLNVAALSFASSGAMGEAGGLYLISFSSKIYHANYLDGSISLDAVYTIFPFLDKCSFNIFDCKGCSNWKGFYMGAGNYLIVRESLYKKIKNRINCLEEEDLYEQWDKIVLEYLENK
ncbi:MAG: hypothetical protein K6B45_02485 [Bacteroidaceae bacterium]|nr:hypothetical protein [Bacteroidaceae bacterium]